MRSALFEDSYIEEMQKDADSKESLFHELNIANTNLTDFQFVLESEVKHRERVIANLRKMLEEQERHFDSAQKMLKVILLSHIIIYDN